MGDEQKDLLAIKCQNNVTQKAMFSIEVTNQSQGIGTMGSNPF